MRLKELGREDVAIFTYDLDEEIGEYLVQEKMVKGMGTQRPYEQGVAVALATAKALAWEYAVQVCGSFSLYCAEEQFCYGRGKKLCMNRYRKS